MSTKIQYKNKQHIFDEIYFPLDTQRKEAVMYLRYPLFEDTGLVNQGFSTKAGGVSEGCFSTMNLGFGRGDSQENVMENYRRFAKAIGVSTEDLVLSQQTHTTNVRVITEEDRGNGMTKPQEFHDVDGMVTDVPGLCLVTFYADCVPLYFLDPVKKVIGLSHSGWRGTVGKIGKVTIEKMSEQYGSEPSDILAAVGPSVCQDCYEVSEDVIARFREHYEKQYWDELFYKKENGHYQLNLWRANEIVFLQAGILPEHIAVSNVCTHCNSDVLYSHRTMGNERGSLCAFFGLKA
ncbi:MAG: peptidoglycan editing factor PgeF [Hespellia sp.]|nr:peptidoglycan editing factor PgeF [Hespellia sp.]